MPKAKKKTHACWWNYRIVKRHIRGEDFCTIREVHHSCTRAHSDGKCPTPKTHKTGWAASDTEPHGETPAELLADLHLMLTAFSRPVFDLDEESAKTQKEVNGPSQGHRLHLPEPRAAP